MPVEPISHHHIEFRLLDSQFIDQNQSGITGHRSFVICPKNANSGSQTIFGAINQQNICTQIYQYLIKGVLDAQQKVNELRRAEAPSSRLQKAEHRLSTAQHNQITDTVWLALFHNQPFDPVPSSK